MAPRTGQFEVELELQHVQLVVGAPTVVSAACNNGTLTFAALTLRAASAMRAS